MKTLSVKQVAEALGVGPRAILKRLDKNQLRGIRRANKFGVEEWWIYPTNEIKAALEAAGRIDILGPQDIYNETELDIVDGELLAPDEDETESPEPPQSVNTAGLAAARNSSHELADGVWNQIIGKFLGELRERDQLIGAMQNELAEKDRQLRLLPDFQKAAEAKELEAIALAKQIKAMQELELAKKQELDRLSKVEVETVPSLENALELERAANEKARAELEQRESDNREILEAKARLEKSLQQEIERLKDEKESQAKAIQNQFETLNQKLEKLEKPWWKKMFSAPES